MKERACVFTREQSLALRGGAILLVMLSHYVQWYSGLVPWEELQYALSKCGVYGVNIFFLVSGYGLAKNVGDARPGLRFLLRRAQGAYIPYLLLAGFIELWAGGLRTGESWLNFLTAKDYWFIRVILVFYLLFFAAFSLTGRSWLRILLCAVLTGGYSCLLYVRGYADFWYISNLAFPFGVALALEEKRLLRCLGWGYWFQLLLWGALMAQAVKRGVDVRQLTMLPGWKARYGVWIDAVWMLFVTQLAALMRGRCRALPFLGKMSLELYLLHVFLYYRIVNAFAAPPAVHILLALGLTLLLAWLVNRTLQKVWEVLPGMLWGRAEGPGR